MRRYAFTSDEVEAATGRSTIAVQSALRRLRHLGRTDYVGILTAAALHGAAHQQPMVFQVLADRAVQPMTAGRGTIEVHANRAVGDLPVVRVQTETGTMAVGTPETPAFDLVRFPAAAGHWSHVATVLTELAGQPLRLAGGLSRCWLVRVRRSLRRHRQSLGRRR